MQSVHDKVDNKVLLSQEQHDRLYAEVPKMKLITVSAVVENSAWSEIMH